MKMHKVQVPMAELNRCTEERKNTENLSQQQQLENWVSKELFYTLHKLVRKRFSQMRQLYSISMNYDRWICAIRVAYKNQRW